MIIMSTVFHTMQSRRTRQQCLSILILIVAADSLPSIHDCLLIGSPRVSDLCAILAHFRCHYYDICTDIEKAFLHVYLHLDDRTIPVSSG